MLNYFYKNKNLHEIKLHSNYNKIIKNEFYNWNTSKRHKKGAQNYFVAKVTSWFFVCFVFVLSWGFYKWAIKRYTQLIERKKIKAYVSELKGNL